MPQPTGMYWDNEEKPFANYQFSSNTAEGKAVSHAVENDGCSFMFNHAHGMTLAFAEIQSRRVDAQSIV